MPALNVVAQPAGTPPRVALSWTWDTATTVGVQRLDPDAGRPVRGAETVTYLSSPAGGSASDYECPFGVPVRYQITGADGSFIVSDEVTLDPTAWYPNDLEWSTQRGAVWLAHLSIPQLSMAIDLANADSPAFKQTRTVVDVLDRRSPIVLSDTKRKNATTTLDVRTWSLEEAAALRELLADNSVLLLTVPARERWGITQLYLTVGDVTEERLWQEWAPFEGRVFHLPCEVVDRPSGGVIFPACCYWSMQRGQDTYVQFDQLYGNYAKLAACDVNAVAPPDPVDPGDDGGNDGGDTGDDGTQTYTELARVDETDSDGTYGSSSTTYGDRAYYTSDSTSAAYTNTAMPVRVITISSVVNAGDVFEFFGQCNPVKADSAGSIALTARVTPGPSATATSGTLVGSGPSYNFSGGDYGNLSTSAGGAYPAWTCPASGTYTFALVLAGSAPTISTGPGYTQIQTTLVVYRRPATVTVVGADDVTMSLQATVVGGTDYLVTAEQWFDNAAEAYQVATRYQYGTQTGPSIGLALNTATLDSTTEPYRVGVTGFFRAASSGVVTLEMVVSSDGTVDDATSTDQPRFLAIGDFE